MDNRNSTPSPPQPGTTGEQPNQTVDEVLTQLDELLKGQNGAEPLLPGASNIVPILRSILNQIHGTRTNSGAASEFNTTLRGLVESLSSSVRRIAASSRPLNNEQSNTLESFKEVVAQLESELNTVPADIISARRGNFIGRLCHRDYVNEVLLGAVKEKLTRLKEEFRGKQAPIVAAFIEQAAAGNEKSSGIETSQGLNALSSAPAPQGSTPQNTSNTKKGKTFLDAILGRIDDVLQLLGDVSSVVPVAGFGVAVPIVRLIVAQLRQTSENSDTASELAKDIETLVKLVNNTVDVVRKNIDLTRRHLGKRQNAAFDPNKREPPELLGRMITELKRDLIAVLENVQSIQAQGYARNVAYNKEIEAQLGEARKNIQKAVSEFRDKQAILVTSTVQCIHKQILNVSSAMKNTKYDDDLANLKHVQSASYRSFDDLGLLEGTRTNLFNKTDNWENSFGTKRSARVLALYGPAGTGKTTFAREVCRRLEAKGGLGASYFFRSSAEVLGPSSKGFPTIAYQLANLHYVFRPHIAVAAREFNNNPSASSKDQLNSLLMGPVNKARTQDHTTKEPEPLLAKVPIVIVLDALDEAGDYKYLVEFLKGLKSLLDAYNNFGIFVTTRPESAVKRALVSSGIDEMKMQVNMEDVPGDEVGRDIQNFLQHGFSTLQWGDKLLDRHKDSIKILTAKAQRLFIYAQTVIGHLEDNRLDVSSRRLAAILHDRSGKTGLAALNNVYMNVLSNVYNDEEPETDFVLARVIAVLAGLVAIQGPLTVTVLVSLMNLEEDAVVMTLDDLRSVLLCSCEDLRKATIRPLHLTFIEFLTDSVSNAKRFYVDRRVYHQRLMKTCLRTLNNKLRRNPSDLSDAVTLKGPESFNDECARVLFQYACDHWSDHLVEIEPTGDPESSQLLEDFCRESLFPWFELQSISQGLDDVLRTLELVHSRVKDLAGFATASSLLHDVWQFIAEFFGAIDYSPKSIRTSGLSSASYRAYGGAGFLKGTMTSLFRKTEDWENGSGTATSAKILVLSGASGTGKTTFAHEVCHRLEARGGLRVSYFFCREDRGSPSKVFMAIGYQLAKLHYAFRPYLADAAREFVKTQPKDRLNSLIVDPVKKARSQDPILAEVPVVIFLDALDEADAVEELLKGFKSLVEGLDNFRILVTTRHLPSVMVAFSSPDIDALKMQVIMENVPGDEVDQDIRTYLQHHLSALRWGDELLKLYPYSIDVLTQKAERLFLYAQTVVGHLKHPNRDVSLQRLTRVVHDISHDAWCELDVLYTEVLCHAYDGEVLNLDDIRARVTVVLAGLVVFQEPLTVKVLVPLMDLEEDEVIQTLEGIRSVLSSSHEDLQIAQIRPLHISFVDFLVDSHRSAKSGFHIGLYASHQKFAKACLRTLNDELHRDPCSLNDANAFKDDIEDLESLIENCVPEHVRYACEHWSDHLVGNDSTGDPVLRQSLTKFCEESLLPWIELQSLSRRLHHAKRTLELVHSWVKDHADCSTVSRILSNVLQYLEESFDAIDASPGIIYTSGILLAPDHSETSL